MPSSPLQRRGRFGLRSFRMPPPATLCLIYLSSIIVGAGLLSLPFATAPDVDIGLMTAVFISTSAVTVTGLSTVDVGATFSLFGEVVIAALIQLGGLGLMTFAVMVLSALGIPVGMPQRLILREDLGQTTLNNLTVLVRIILVVALTCELLATCILSFVFIPEFGVAHGMWLALFHAISAFNNAGFSLLPTGLVPYVADPIVNIVIPVLFILGGLGFVVVGDIYQKRSWQRLTLHSKLMLSGSACLIVFGFVTFALLEWTNPGTLGALPSSGQRLWASWFQAVTPRTAGFNTLDTGAMHDSTTMLTMLLMFVGGGSTSTAGGIKVTTLIVLIVATIAFFRRTSGLNIFGRSLKMEEVMKVLALTTVSMILVFVGLFFVSISHDGEFLDLAFEVVSAFGTVGLSRGATAELDGIGLSFIMLMMFAGRVGPLALGFFLATRSAPRVKFAPGQIYLG
ncbi:TrkH family potassium uptake protein [Loktanella sp. 3ANDIMAR09]|uniref:TrkH family potassium uptake protein n=1 Tax=Loktanella sp. 3ANDIMAR09 TaxID=1225657 RepID=UPI000ADD2BCF|nr:potassium transporter TrkG [Loktanella sp. 3ANDIMAR09]